MSEWVQPEHREIDEFLTSWGRWLKTKQIQGHCGSIEHQWRSPQCWDERHPRPEINESQAELIESLMRIVPKHSRKLLKLKYVHRCDPVFITRRLRLKDYPQALYTARQIILNLARHALHPEKHGRSLALSKELAHTPQNSLVPTLVETSPS